MEFLGGSTEQSAQELDFVSEKQNKNIVGATVQGLIGTESN